MQFVLRSTVMNRNLSYNKITSISNGTFTGLGSLSILFATLHSSRNVILFDSNVMGRDLSYNQITSIFDGAFTGLDSLISLFVASMTRCTMHFVLHLTVINRYLHINRITSISKGAFPDLGSLTELFATCTFVAPCTHVSFIQQGSVLQQNHIDIQRRLRWTWQLDNPVRYLNFFLRVLMLHSTVINRNLFNNQITSISNGIFTGLDSLTTLFVVD
jgi:hypothetical protein